MARYPDVPPPLAPVVSPLPWHTQLRVSTLHICMFCNCPTSGAAGAEPDGLWWQVVVVNGEAIRYGPGFRDEYTPGEPPERHPPGNATLPLHAWALPRLICDLIFDYSQQVTGSSA